MQIIMKQQSGIEFLLEKYKEQNGLLSIDDFEKAKEVHKQKIRYDMLGYKKALKLLEQKDLNIILGLNLEDLEQKLDNVKINKYGTNNI